MIHGLKFLYYKHLKLTKIADKKHRKLESEVFKMQMLLWQQVIPMLKISEKKAQMLSALRMDLM